MSENRMGIRFHAWRPNHEVSSDQSHAPANSQIRPKPNHVDDPIKQPNPYEYSASYGEGRRFGFPSSMFQRGDKNVWPDQTVITEGGWVRPSPAGWTLPPEAPLEPAVKNSYAAAANSIVRSPARVAGGGTKMGWSSGPAIPVKKNGTGTPFLDTNIDSREAATKYGGRFMFK